MDPPLSIIKWTPLWNEKNNPVLAPFLPSHFPTIHAHCACRPYSFSFSAMARFQRARRTYLQQQHLREQVLLLRSQNLGLGTICKKLKCGKSTVWSIVSRFGKRSTVKDKPRRGRQSSLTKRYVFFNFLKSHFVAQVQAQCQNHGHAAHGHQLKGNHRFHLSEYLECIPQEACWCSIYRMSMPVSIHNASFDFIFRFLNTPAASRSAAF